MKILAINIDETTSWAFYNSEHSEKISNGRIVFKIAEGETIKAPCKRFYNILENCIYHHGDGVIDKIVYYYKRASDPKILCSYKKTLSEFKEKYLLSEPIRFEESLLKEVQELGKKYDKYIIEDSDIIALQILLFELDAG